MIAYRYFNIPNKKDRGIADSRSFFNYTNQKPWAYGSKPTVFLFYNIMLVSVDLPTNGR
jgi:hypothetical protein